MSIPYVRRDSEAEIFTEWGGIVQELVMPPVAPVKHLTLEVGIFQPGEELKEHVHHESEEIYFVIKGSALVNVDHKEYGLTDGMAMVIPSGAFHNVKNVGKEELRIVFATSPPEKY